MLLLVPVLRYKEDGESPWQDKRILPLLPRKSAIRTGVLSWRWRDLWSYRWPRMATLIFGEELGRGLSAEEFVSSVEENLKLRGNKKVEIFRLFFYPGNLYQSNTANWIEYAII